MIKVIRLEAWHIEALRGKVQDHVLFNSVDQAACEEDRYSYTFYDGESGEIMMCTGVRELWAGRGVAWVLFNQECTEQFILLFRGVKRFLELCPINRIESVVLRDFKAGHRWVKLLGFKLEAECMKSFNPAGQDCSLYARVRN